MGALCKCQRTQAMQLLQAVDHESVGAEGVSSVLPRPRPKARPLPRPRPRCLARSPKLALVQPVCLARSAAAARRPLISASATY